MKIPKEISNDKLLEIVAKYYGIHPDCLATTLDETRGVFYIEYFEDGFENDRV